MGWDISSKLVRRVTTIDEKEELIGHLEKYIAS